MQGDDKHRNDLEYLAQQGFENVPLHDSDLNDLTKKVRLKSFSYNTNLYFALISLIIGVFIGASLFFILVEDVPDRLPKEVIVSKINSAKTHLEIPSILLDPVVITKENFIAPQVKETNTRANTSENALTKLTDSIMIIPEKPIDVNLFNKGKFEEAKLKFIANASVIYIHDLKVTDYTLLYFKQNKFIKFNDRAGLTADHSNRTELTTDSHLKENPDYFLHEELAKGLLYFKKENYDQSITALNTVSAYNDDDINCDFYLGMCYFHKHNYLKSVELLDKCISNRNNTFLQEAMYYKALALYDSGKKEEAMNLFKQIANEDGFYAEKAKEYF